MHLSLQKITIMLAVFASLAVAVDGQNVKRELNLATGATIVVVNHFGRITVQTVADKDGKSVSGSLTASSPKGVSDGEIRIGGAAERVTVAVVPADTRKRIDLTLIVPERSTILAETLEGAIEATGNFAAITAKTDTGTVAVDVPTDDLTYYFLWTESHPRYLADFELSEVKEKNAGRFEIKGHRNGEVQSSKFKVQSSKPEDQEPKTEDQRPKTEDQKPRIVSLNFSTARGIILLNVPPNEVMSDLRERPLTQAAKAIVRSGDSLLMDAIRRASPRYFGDYMRSLPPIKREPVLMEKKQQAEMPGDQQKTALVRITDLNNRTISGLEAKDFEVLENGTGREIVSVEHSTAPFNLVLLLDVSGSVENYVNFIRKTARAFVNTVDKRDRVSIVIFNDDIKVLSRFTTDKGKLSESLDTFDAGGGTAYYDALAYVISDTLRPLKGERTAIVILTDGDDNRSFLAFDSLLGSIQESGALIYPLYVPSALIAEAAQNPNADIDPLRKKYMSLSAKSAGEGDRLARVSGGVYYPITQTAQIQRAYEDIVLQLRTAYNVTFRSGTAAVGGNGVSPHLKIKIKRENAFATINSVTAAPQ